jgi:hypothetical protein
VARLAAVWGRLSDAERGMLLGLLDGAAARAGDAGAK